jgi:hypothetical protein
MIDPLLELLVGLRNTPIALSLVFMLHPPKDCHH